MGSGSFSGALVEKPSLLTIPTLPGKVAGLSKGLPSLPLHPATRTILPCCMQGMHSWQNRGLPEPGTDSPHLTPSSSWGKPRVILWETRCPSSAAMSWGTPGAPRLLVPHHVLPTSTSAPKNAWLSWRS